MKTNNGRWTLPAVAAVLFAGGLLVQWSERATLCQQLDTAREQAREVDVVRAENHRLSAGAISPEQLGVLRNDQAALVRLRAELASIRTSQALQGSAPQATVAKIPRDAREWSDVGAATPAQALETALWALKTGQLDVFARQVVFTPEDRSEVDKLFTTLPDVTRAQYGTVERWVAAMTARNLPLESASLAAQPVWVDDRAELSVEMQGEKLPSGAYRSKSATVSLRRADDGWRLVVPLAVVRQYASESRNAVRT